MIILQNEWLRVAIAPAGAELQSLQHKTTGIEHMWNGDAAYWAKRSPVLFPIVGTLKEDTYYFQQQAYKLPRHGFAREKVFAAQQLSETEALFSLGHDDGTLAVFPFEFLLQIRYRLQENSLTCGYEISNPGTTDLLFSIGAHPAFALPFTPNSQYDDHYLQFNKPEELQRCKLVDGLLSTVTEPLPTPGNRLPLHASLFYEDAIVLKNLQSNTITLASDKHAHGIHFHFNQFSFFGIWAAKDAPFICLEPWCGIADNTGHKQQFEEKEGIEKLEPAGRFERQWRVECF